MYKVFKPYLDQMHLQALYGALIDFWIFWGP